MNDMLNAAAQTGSIELLYLVIQEDPYVLERIDEIPFINTPLHIAASEGHTSFATEIMRLKPSFAWKLNQYGFSPMHLALQNDRHRMVRRLVHMNKDLVRVKGREGLTPLHLAIEIGELRLIAEFLLACPDSVEDVTVAGDTVMHVAIKRRQFEALKVLVGWLRRTRHQGALEQQISILNWQDEAGNTILHLAALENDTQVVKLLVDNMVNTKLLNIKNLEGSTALDIVLDKETLVNNTEMRSMLRSAGALRGSSLPFVPHLADVLRSNITFEEKIAIPFIRLRKNISSETRNALLVVASLISSITAGTLNFFPGGGNTSSSSSSSSSSSYSNQTSQNTVRVFPLFWISNMTSLLVSTLMICVLLPSKNLSYPLFVPLIYFSYYYSWSMAATWPDPVGFYLNMFLFFLLSILYAGGTFLLHMVTRRVTWYGSNRACSKSKIYRGNRW